MTDAQAMERMDKLMEAVGALTMGETLSILIELSAHLILDDLRVQLDLGGGVYTEQRLSSEVIKPLVDALAEHGFLPEGFAEDDDEPIPFTLVEAPKDGKSLEQMFHLGDD